MQSQSPDKKHVHVTFLGDSTIDNKVWVDGIFKNIFFTWLGIKHDEPAVRVKKSHHWFGWFGPTLSVVENVMDMLPNEAIHDYTNDGFTTKDLLYGNFKDKVFGNGWLSLFPHQWFDPIKKGSEDIKKSDYIILSIGGNDFREFLLSANRLTGEARKAYIQGHFPALLKCIHDRYLLIYKQLRELNHHARIILMTQYYPAVLQSNPLLKIYPFMHEIGQALNMGGDEHEAMNVIHEIMQQTYAAIFKHIADDHNLVVVDITSSLNPYDNHNYISQIEPSGIGGKKIAQMLKYVMTGNQIAGGFAYRFAPAFFEANNQSSQSVASTALSQWVPMHPYDLYENGKLANGAGIKLFAQNKPTLLTEKSVSVKEITNQQPRI